MKVIDLVCDPLDIWVCRAELAEFTGRRLNAEVIAAVKAKLGDDLPYWPSRDWRIGSRIIEREGIAMRPLAQLETFRPGELSWEASYLHGEHKAYGRTALEAAMRCFVKSKYGDEVPYESV